MFKSRAGEEDVEGESVAFMKGSSDSPQILPRRPVSQRSNIWVWTTFILAFLLLAIGVRDLAWSKGDASRKYAYETGFETDWSLAREVSRTKKVKFSGGIQFHEDETRYLTTNPDEPVYIGPPSPELDAAWDELTYHASIAVTPAEAKAVTDKSGYDKYRGHYTVGLSVLHSLHCLDALRKAQDVEYYRAKGDPEEWWQRFHIDHCINHLRQAIQCHSDLTPFPLTPAVHNASRRGWITPNFDVEHTCRDFSAIRKWAREKHDSGIEKAKAAPKEIE
ncbi:hypothetical protein F5Y18DRAFT_431172 [Xylariaceae sp. FL1019]|nr:hypothetical protein F5Y18DRAFT_431172 [Xylariaceae sp. FL1019]